MKFRNRLGEIVTDMPGVPDANGTVRQIIYHWGGFDDLIEFLNVQKQKYPLIWLESSPDDVDTESNTVTRKRAVIYIATRVSQTDKNNIYQTQTAFKHFLDPIEANLIKGLQRSITSLFDGSYTSAELTKLAIVENKQTLEVWNAIKITADITFNNYCFKTINYG